MPVLLTCKPNTTRGWQGEYEPTGFFDCTKCARNFSQFVKTIAATRQERGCRKELTFEELGQAGSASDHAQCYTIQDWLGMNNTKKIL